MLSSQRRRRIQNHATAQNFVFFFRDRLLRHLPTSSYYYSHEATTSTLGGCPMELAGRGRISVLVAPAAFAALRNAALHPIARSFSGSAMTTVPFPCTKPAQQPAKSAAVAGSYKQSAATMRSIPCPSACGSAQSRREPEHAPASASARSCTATTINPDTAAELKAQ